jgi:hypothetical protein
MFFNPEITGRLVNDRVEQRRHQAAGRRLAGPSRRRNRRGLRMPRVSWFGRRRRTPCAPEPATA